jgi:hypothetical protein
MQECHDETEFLHKGVSTSFAVREGHLMSAVYFASKKSKQKGYADYVFFHNAKTRQTHTYISPTPVLERGGYPTRGAKLGSYLIVGTVLSALLAMMANSLNSKAPPTLWGVFALITIVTIIFFIIRTSIRYEQNALTKALRAKAEVLGRKSCEAYQDGTYPAFKKEAMSSAQAEKTTGVKLSPKLASGPTKETGNLSAPIKKKSRLKALIVGGLLSIAAVWGFQHLSIPQYSLKEHTSPAMKHALEEACGSGQCFTRLHHGSVYSAVVRKPEDTSAQRLYTAVIPRRTTLNTVPGKEIFDDPKLGSCAVIRYACTNGGQDKDCYALVKAIDIETNPKYIETMKEYAKEAATLSPQ